MSSSPDIERIEKLLTEEIPNRFRKFDRSEVRMAITDVLQLLPLPCRGCKITPDLCGLIQDLERIEKGEDPVFHGSPKEVIADLSDRVIKILKGDS